MDKKLFRFIGMVMKTGILGIVLLSSTATYAQDEVHPDSLATIIDESLSAPDEEEEEAEEEKEKKEAPDYFLPAKNDSIQQLRTVSDSIVAALRNDDDFWYANAVFKQKEQQARKKPFFRSNFFQALLWLVAVGGFITFLIIFLSNSQVNLFRRKSITVQPEPGEEVTDIFAIHYEKEIEKAIAAGNYRLAVRLQFLRLLRLLSDRKIIQYKQDNTNFDYLLQVQKASWYHLFFRLTRHYEYVWYGKFEIDNKKFDYIRDDFAILEQQLPPA